MTLNIFLFYKYSTTTVKLAKGLVLQHVPVSLQTKYGSLLHMVWTVRLMKSGRRHNASNLFGYSLA